MEWGVFDDHQIIGWFSNWLLIILNTFLDSAGIWCGKQGCGNSQQRECWWKGGKERAASYSEHLQAYTSGSRTSTFWSICCQIQSSKFGEGGWCWSSEISIFKVCPIGFCSIWKDWLPVEKESRSCCMAYQTIPTMWSFCVCRLCCFYGCWQFGKYICIYE